MDICHYTNISSLALILKNKTLRFTRSDLLDDTLESCLSDNFLGCNLFISSWGVGDEESIPQWAMYGDSFKGVRIALESDGLFDWHKININMERKYGKKKIGLKIKDAECPCDKNTVLGNGYIIIPYACKAHFAGEVQYLDDLKNIYSRLEDVKNGVDTSADGTSYPAFFKHKNWHHQKEFRFVLTAASGPNLEHKNNDKEYEEKLYELLYENIKGNNKNKTIVKHIDIPISFSILDKIKIQLGPLSSESDKILVKSLCKEFAPNATIEKSSLRGVIRGR